MSTFKRARLKYNLLSYGGGILFGAAAMGFWIVAMQFRELVRP